MSDTKKFAIDKERMDEIYDANTRPKETSEWRLIWFETWQRAYQALVSHWTEQVNISQRVLDSNKKELRRIVMLSYTGE